MAWYTVSHGTINMFGSPMMAFYESIVTLRVVTTLADDCPD